MPSSSILRARGLHTFSNYFTAVPEGALLTADNVIIDADGKIQPRRGIATYGTVDTDPAQSPSQLAIYKNRVLSYLNHKLYFDNGSSVFTAFTSDGTSAYTFSPAGNFRTKSIETQGNYYFTTADGVKKISLSSPAGLITTPGQIPIVTAAGGVRALDTAAELDYTATNGFLLAGNTTAYRVLWVYTDANNNLILGYPSFNTQVSNASLTNGYGVKLTIQVPQELIGVSGYSYQIYRSANSVPTTTTDTNGVVSSQVLNPASDELFQVYQSSYDGVATSITVSDNTPESIRANGTPLYTNEYSGQGITQANSPPPLCQDIALYKNFAFYSNTKQKQAIDFTLQGMDGFAIFDGYSDNNNKITSIVYSGGISTFTLTGSSAGHNMVIGSSQQVVLFATNSNPAAVVTATFPTSTTITIPGDYSALTPAKVSIFASFIDLHHSISTRFFFVGRPTETQLVVGTGMSSWVAGMNPSFNINSADDSIKYAFWYKITAADTFTQAVPAGTLPIAIDVTTYNMATITQDQVVNLTIDAINNTGDFYAVKDGSNPHQINILTSDSGKVSSGTALFIVSPGSGWTIIQTLDGVGEQISNKFIKLSSSISAGLAIQSTAKSMTKVINRNVSDINFFYTSDVTALPGAMEAVAISYSTAAFNITASQRFYADGTTQAVGSMFNPVMDTAQNTTQVISSAETNINRFFYSKQYEPESVPALNFIDVGPKDKAILRIIALKNTLFILKEEGIYSLTGSDPSSFYLALFDSSTLLVAPDTAQVLNNQIYMLSSQGVATVTETGVGIISRPVEDIFTRIKNSTFTNYDTASFGCAYESDRSYMIFTVFNTTDTYATKVYRYNTFTQAWTSWTWNASSAVVNPLTTIDKLYIGNPTINTVEQERKNLSRTDYADYDYPIAFLENGISGNNIQVSSLANVSNGDMIVQTQYLTISEFNRLLLKLDRDGGFTGIAFVNTFTTIPGDNIGRKLLLLTTQLHNYNSFFSISSGNSDFATVQSEFNTLISQLNDPAAPSLFKNYLVSSGTSNQEILINSSSYYQNTVNTSTITPILFGPATLYKGISTNVIWAPVAFGDPSLLKHIREGTFLFEHDAIASATVGYASDLSTNFESIPFNMEGDGSFGNNTWNEFSWGGVGTSRPFRTLIPRQKQRCRFINAQFQHINAYYKFTILGISFVFEPTSTRGYR